MYEQSQIVGLIGIGQLGIPVVANLLQAGFRVVGYRRHDLEEFARLGGNPWNRPRRWCRRPMSSSVLAVRGRFTTGAGRRQRHVHKALGPRHIVVEMGTYRKAFKLEQAAKIAALGAKVLEAEIAVRRPWWPTARPPCTSAATQRYWATCTSILQAISPNLFCLGEYGSCIHEADSQLPASHSHARRGRGHEHGSEGGLRSGAGYGSHTKGRRRFRHVRRACA